MRQALVSGVAVALLLAAVAGCAAGDGMVVGTWTVDLDELKKELEQSLRENPPPGMTDQILAENLEKEMEVHRRSTYLMEFKADHTCTWRHELARATPVRRSGSGTWKLDGSTVTYVSLVVDGVKVENATPMTATFRDGRIYAKDGERTIVYRRR